MNRTIDRYDVAIKAIAGEQGADYLPLHEALVSFLDRGGPGKTPSEAGFFSRKLLVLRRYYGLLSRDELGDSRGYFLFTDGVHLNDRAGKVVSGLIGNWLREKVAIPARRSSTAAPRMTRP